jgi:hypothetical protein
MNAELMDWIETHASEIYVEAAYEGRADWYPLVSLPAITAIRYVFDVLRSGEKPELGRPKPPVSEASP